MQGYKECPRCHEQIPGAAFAGHVKKHASKRKGRKAELDPRKRKLLNVNIIDRESIRKFLELHGELGNDHLFETFQDIIEETYENHFPGVE